MIAEDIVDEARRLMRAASDTSVRARVIGGVAVALHAPRGLPEPLQRPYADLDLVTVRNGGQQTTQFLVASGYQPNERFNALNSDERLVFYDTAHRRQVDVFVGTFRMCHELPIADRLHLESETAPLAELLLTKLQVVKLNQKDLKDAYALLLEHPVGNSDDDMINGQYIGQVLGSDWGLWRTSTRTLEVAKARLPESGLDERQQAVVRGRIDELSNAAEGASKSRKWRVRARLGDRVRWYEEPEEVEHQIGDLA